MTEITKDSVLEALKTYEPDGWEYQDGWLLYGAWILEDDIEWFVRICDGFVIIRRESGTYVQECECNNLSNLCVIMKAMDASEKTLNDSLIYEALREARKAAKKVS